MFILKKQGDEDSGIKFRVPLGNESYEINFLEPDTEYTIKIAAVNNFGRGEYFPPVIFKTNKSKRYSYIHDDKASLQK